VPAGPEGRPSSRTLVATAGLPEIPQPNHTTSRAVHQHHARNNGHPTPRREALGALADSIKRWTGGVVIISHHEEFIGAVCSEVREGGPAKPAATCTCATACTLLCCSLLVHMILMIHTACHRHAHMHARTHACVHSSTTRTHTRTHAHAHTHACTHRYGTWRRAA